MAGKFNLMLSLFGLPFLIGTIILGSLAVMTVCGKVVVSTSYNEGKVFTGVGPFGWTRKFDWASVTHIKKTSAYRSESDIDTGHWQITIVGDERTKLNYNFDEDRRLYMLNALRSLMNARNHGRGMG